jgi:hypothetical protein
MDKKVRIICIVVLVLLTGLLIMKSCKKDKYNTFTFPKTLVVNNYTNDKLADTVALIILNKIMKYDTMTINIYKIRDNYDTEEFNFVSYITKIPFKKHEYIIFLKNDLFLDYTKTVLSHELVHLDQYESGRLKIMEDGYEWMNITTKFKDENYLERPYELEAFKKQNDIKKKLNKIFIK